MPVETWGPRESAFMPPARRAEKDGLSFVVRRMHRISSMRVDTSWGRGLLVLAAVHLATVTAPSVAWAQAQPVPYPTLPPPVPYGEPAPPPGAAVQRAPAVGLDTIYMKNGGILRGTIIDAIPDAQARIQLATGEIATVPWQAIDRIEHGSTGPGRPAPPGPVPAPPTPAPPGPRVYAPSAMVWVHVEGGEGSLLETDRASDGTWETACRAPCDIQVPTSADYRIGGSSRRQSGMFHLRGQQGDHVTVTVSGGSKAWLITGIVITPVGGLVTLIGLVMGLAGSVSAEASESGCIGTTCTQASGSTNPGLATAGWITALVGVAVGVGGIVLIVNNAKTGVAVDVTGAQAARVQGDAWAHVPSWRETGSAEKAIPPVFGGTVDGGDSSEASAARVPASRERAPSTRERAPGSAARVPSSATRPGPRDGPRRGMIAFPAPRHALPHLTAPRRRVIGFPSPARCALRETTCGAHSIAWERAPGMTTRAVPHRDPTAPGKDSARPGMEGPLHASQDPVRFT